MIKHLTNSKSKITRFPANQDDPKQRKPDISVAKKSIGWQPTWSVSQGLVETIAYFRRELEESGEIVPTGPQAAKPRPRATG